MATLHTRDLKDSAKEHLTRGAGKTRPGLPREFFDKVMQGKVLRWTVAPLRSTDAFERCAAWPEFRWRLWLRKSPRSRRCMAHPWQCGL